MVTFWWYQCELHCVWQKGRRVDPPKSFSLSPIRFVCLLYAMWFLVLLSSSSKQQGKILEKCLLVILFIEVELFCEVVAHAKWRKIRITVVSGFLFQECQNTARPFNYTKASCIRSIILILSAHYTNKGNCSIESNVACGRCMPINHLDP